MSLISISLDLEGCGNCASDILWHRTGHCKLNALAWNRIWAHSSISEITPLSWNSITLSIVLPEIPIQQWAKCVLRCYENIEISTTLLKFLTHAYPRPSINIYKGPCGLPHPDFVYVEDFCSLVIKKLRVSNSPICRIGLWWSHVSNQKACVTKSGGSTTNRSRSTKQICLFL